MERSVNTSYPTRAIEYPFGLAERLRRRIKIHSGATAAIATLLLMASLSAVAQAEPSAPSAREKGDDWANPIKSSFWGNVSKDSKVDLRDLIELGQNFEESKKQYGRDGDKILSELKTKYRARVPKFLIEAEPDTQRLVTDEAIVRQSKGLEKSDVPLAIGYGVSIDTQGNYVLGRQIYDGANPTRIGTLPGSEPITDESFSSRYSTSYQQELEFKSLDVNAEIKYTIFNGALSVRFEQENYSDSRVHKYLAKYRKDYGWYVIPDEAIRERMITGVLEELQNPFAEDGVARKYGSHYAYAVRKFAELQIDINIETRTRRDWRSFEVDARAAFDNRQVEWNVNAAIRTFKETIDQGAIVSVSVSRRGGPSLFALPDGTEIGLPQTLNEGDPRLNNLNSLIDGWRAGVTESNAASDQFYMRPVTDFLDAAEYIPFSRSANLRAWYDAYVEHYQHLQLLQEMLVFSSTDINTPFGYAASWKYLDSMPSGAVGEASFFEFHKKRYATYKDRVDALLETGRDLYSGEISVFNRADWLAPKLEIQPLIVYANFENCWSHMTWGPTVGVPYVNLNDPAGQYTLWVHGLEGFNGGHSDGAPRPRQEYYTAGSAYNSEVPVAQLPFQIQGNEVARTVYWNSTNNGCNHFGSCPCWLAGHSWADVGAVVFQAGEVIGYNCGPNANCALVEFNGPPVNSGFTNVNGGCNGPRPGCTK
jgi:hypothetical protein